ncbi:tRNA 5-methylaminomethyl-2-thiouridine biosynthesis bifunctional protein MnmC [Candidatus Izimaplasma bacterium HR1]|jgi:uncharacterized FAD-dependent dehydrogenase|uniref:NAD(P)/FAD-dependent oxidoreductase n=1 Tax=Candidatus Izimoplasma sp. HR1 TaxID=1541959 RepID=UPI0004F80B94|nr:tRNA 5-methylaminomethyl-2-thiouridine biosynthesis bifunctional protein MnmC [Candidatus Izimaplasma bacterium HR1]
MLLVNQVKVEISDNIEDFKPLLSKLLRVSIEDVLDYRIERRSVDARKKDMIFFVYTLSVKVKGEKRILSKNIPNVSKQVFKHSDVDYTKLNYAKDKKVAVIGFGPAGMFSALKFAQAGVNVTVFERGEEVDKRIKTIEEFSTSQILNTESNIQFGEGGAGTFSDGKLTNRKKDPLGKWLFSELVKAGAPEEILYVHNPHIGTDRLVEVVKNIRKEIIELGSTIKFNSKVSNILPHKKGLNITIGEDVEYFDYVILAIGHSSRDTIEMLYNNKCNIVQKPFAVGFRIEHKQEMINKAQFGPNHNHPKLGSAEYKLTHQTKDGKGVYTFCMCPGGLVVPASSEEGMVVTNGMSEYSRDKVNGNSALLITVDEKDFESSHPLAGIKFQRNLERKAFELGGSNYKAPIQTVGDFINNKTTTELGSVLPSYSIGYNFSNLRNVFTEKINDAFIEAFEKMGNKLKGFNSDDALLTGVESRSSSPVRIVRDKESFESLSTKGLYPVGEGAGYAGGIVSAAIDGIRVTHKILDLIKVN